MIEQGEFVYDLISALRKDPQRASEVTAALKHIDKVAADVANGKAARRDITEAEASVIPVCGFNFGLLIPRFFPRYPFDKPLDFSSRPFMFAMTAMAPGSIVTLKAGRQVGKCVSGDTVVVTNLGAATLRSLFDQGEPVQTSMSR